jgi:hypothetical protein
VGSRVLMAPLLAIGPLWPRCGKSIYWLRPRGTLLTSRIKIVLCMFQRSNSCASGRAGKQRQTACKPGSVPALRRGMAIPLGRPLPDASRDRPGWQGGNTPGLAAGHPYLVLLPVGFALPPPSPAARCALTAPFHPCRPENRGWRCVSVALSLGSPPPGVTRHRISVEPGLSSPRASGERPSGRLADPHKGCRRAEVKSSRRAMRCAPGSRRRARRRSRTGGNGVGRR